MVDSYDINMYLLDKSHIADTMTRMAIGFDGDHQLLIDRVYTPEIQLDYVSVLGGKAETITVEEWTHRLTDIHKGYDYTQHLIQYVVASTSLNIPSGS